MVFKYDIRKMRRGENKLKRIDWQLEKTMFSLAPWTVPMLDTAVSRISLISKTIAYARQTSIKRILY